MNPTKRIISVCVAISVLLCSGIMARFQGVQAQEKPERVLSLEESIRLAKTNNQALLVLSEEENLANHRIKLAKSKKYPEIILGGGYTNLKVTKPMTLSPLLGGTSLDVGLSEYYTTNLSFRQLIYSGGYLSSISREARLNLQEVESDYRLEKRNIVFEVTKNFYTVLLFEEIAGIYEEAVNDQDLMLDLAKQQKTLNEYNLVNAEVQISVLKASLQKARQDLNEAYTLFNKSLGIELNTNVSLQGELVYINNEEYDVNRSITRALQFSPELNRKKIEEQMNDVRVALSQGKLYPSVILGGDLAYSGEEFPPEGKSWMATIAVSLPIFDGWASLTRVKQAKSELRKTKLERVKLSDEIKLRVQQVLSDHERTKDAIKSLEKTRDLCQRSASIAIKAFRKGQISFVELLGTQITLVYARINYSQNLCAYMVSDAELSIITNPVE
ncbi:MAG: TolC family protein [bacterium]